MRLFVILSLVFAQSKIALLGSKPVVEAAAEVYEIGEKIVRNEGSQSQQMRQAHIKLAQAMRAETIGANASVNDEVIARLV